MDLQIQFLEMFATEFLQFHRHWQISRLIRKLSIFASRPQSAACSGSLGIRDGDARIAAFNPSIQSWFKRSLTSVFFPSHSPTKTFRSSRRTLKRRGPCTKSTNVEAQHFSSPLAERKTGLVLRRLPPFFAATILTLNYTTFIFANHNTNLPQPISLTILWLIL